MNKIWREVYDKNYQKSLDHRSFYFKQMDKKTLSTKALLAEIKQVGELKELNHQDGACSLDFELSDESVHVDIFNMVHAATEQQMVEEEKQQLLAFWKKFLAPFLAMGVLPKEDAVEKDAGKDDNEQGVAPMDDDSKDSNDDKPAVDDTAADDEDDDPLLAKCLPLQVIVMAYIVMA